MPSLAMDLFSFKSPQQVDQQGDITQDKSEIEGNEFRDEVDVVNGHQGRKVEIKADGKQYENRPYRRQPQLIQPVMKMVGIL